MKQTVVPLHNTLGIEVHIISYIPQQQNSTTVILDHGALVLDAVRLYCPKRWQEHVFVVSNGKALLRQDVLLQGTTLEIFPIVDGG